MQMFGIGVLELLVILMLTVIVVGPDRMPQVAADLARWIRQGRAYARHLMGDFNSVVSELQKEADVSQEDWKEITSVVSRNTGEIGKELKRVVKDVEDAGDLSEAKTKAEAPAAAASNGNGANGSNGTNGATTKAEQPAEEASAEETETEEDTPAEEKPWYEPERTPRPSRRRSRSHE
jgi:sec-independent protein translocase protein TatB